MADYQTISIVFTGLSVSLAAFYYISTLRNAQRTRELQLHTQEQATETRKIEIYMQLIRQTRTTEFMKQWSMVVNMKFNSHEEWYEKYGPEADPDYFAAYVTVLQTYNSIAQLVKKGVLDIETLYDLIMPQGFYRAWDIAKPQITDWSKENGYHPWETLEWLVGELDQYLENKRIQNVI